MIKLSVICKAKTDSKINSKIYEKIFFDVNGNNKVRMWLVKNGVNYNELDDVESMMSVTFSETIIKYDSDKIPFEIYVWNKFKHSLLNYFFTKNNIKKGNEESLDELCDEIGYEIISSDKCFNEVMFDFDKLISLMNPIHSFICKCKYYTSWNDFEIVNYINKLHLTNEMTDANYYDELDKIRNIFDEYIKGNI